MCRVLRVALQRNALSVRYNYGACITPAVEGFAHDEFTAYISFCLALQQDIHDPASRPNRQATRA